MDSSEGVFIQETVLDETSVEARDRSLTASPRGLSFLIAWYSQSNDIPYFVALGVKSDVCVSQTEIHYIL